MKALKCTLKDADRTKKLLIEKNLLDFKYIPLKEQDFLYFPLVQSKTTFKPTKGQEIVEKALKKKKEKLSFRKELEMIIPKNLQDFIKTSYDTLGDLAIIEISYELNDYRQAIGKALLRTNKTIRTVLQRGKHEGTFRLQKLNHIAGKPNKETTVMENGVHITLNPEEVYYSTRLATERLRIARQVKKDEDVLVMFSGCSPYECTLSKNSPAKSIVGVEINPRGHHYSLINLKQNKLKNVQTYCGNVRTVVPELIEKGKRFDRIIMPLPKDAPLFTELALNALRDKPESGIKSMMINMYIFGTKPKMLEQKAFVEEILKANK
ncbi:hypothetical protein JW868_01735, partial [Candidatus Woesearchaeota archaeon]|nr:hypothetical protein [Candidatus Woesearchaeota archaeon]